MAIRRSVEYNVKSTGGDDAKAAVDAITKSLEASGNAAKSTAKSYDAVSAEATKLGKDARGIGSLFHQIGYAMAGQETPSKKFVAMLSASKAGFDSLTKGIKDFGGVIAGAAGLFGPYGMLLGGIVSAVKSLWDLFSDPSPVETTTESIDKQSNAVDRLSSKLAALGGTVDVMTARRMLQVEDMIKAETNAYAKAGEQLGALEAKVYIALEDMADKRKTLISEEDYIRTLGARENRYAEYIQQEMKGVTDAYEAAKKAYEDAKEIVKKGDLAAAVKADLEAEAEAIEAIKAATDATDKALESHRKEAEAKEKAAAERRRAQYKADQDALTAILQRGEEVRWAMTEHTALEVTNRDIDRRKKEVSEKIKDAKLLQEALNVIEMTGILERQKATEQDNKKRAEQMKALGDKIAAAQALRPVTGGESEESKLQESFKRERDVIKQSIEQTRSALEEIEKLSEEEQIAFIDRKKDLLSQIAALNEESARKELSLMRDVNAARKKAQEENHKAYLKQIKDAVALSDANKAAMNSTIDGMNVIAQAMEQWGAGAGAVQAVEMTASGLKASADAIDYAAEAAAAYANLDIVRGAALTAASIAKGASAAAYAKGLIELGKNGFNAPSGGELGAVATAQGGATQSASTAALTGSQGGSSQHQTIDVNLLYSGGGPELANALIKGLNASANNSGMSRINASLIAK